MEWITTCLQQSVTACSVADCVCYSVVSTVVDCEALTHPLDGQVNTSSGTTYNQVATYSCDTGYNFVGPPTRTCQDSGMWSSTAPVCVGEYIYLQGLIWQIDNYLQYYFISQIDLTNDVTNIIHN